MTRDLMVSGALLMILAAPRADAQVLRGRVLDRITGGPIAGALVSLTGADSTSEPLRTVLTSEDGRYALRAPSPGQFRVAAKRIGVQRRVSDIIELQSGETRELSLVLDPVRVELPSVRVAVAGFCVARNSEEGHVAALWDEVRTALIATSVTVRDSLQRARIVSYSRVLDPRSMRVLEDDNQERRGTVTATFTSLPADSLVKVGFWSELGEDTLSFYGPDIAVLLSSAFVRNHCFSLAPSGRGPSGLVGLQFEPRPGFVPNGIQGTIWVGKSDHALSHLEFGYTRLPRVEYMNKVGGEVHFSRLPNGRWIIPRWFIRMPQYARYEAASQVQRYDRARSTSIRLPSIYRILEQGGELFPENARAGTSVTVQVQDSLGMPIQLASVGILGTTRSSTVAGGEATFERVPEGTWRLQVRHASYDSLGLSAREVDVRVAADSSATFSIRADNMAALIQRACGNASHVSSGVLRVVDHRGLPLRKPALRLRWTSYRDQPVIPRVNKQSVDVTLDDKRSATICSVPANMPILVEDAASGRVLATIRIPSSRITLFELQ